MPEEVTNINEVKTSSDGTVKLSIETYNDLLGTISKQKSSINRINEQLNQLRSEPPVINRTTVVKTAEMAAKEYRVWGGTLMGLGATLFTVGAFLYKNGRV
jgi:hypothetical protein